MLKMAKTPEDITRYTKSEKILFIDTETTGLDWRKDKIRLVQIKTPKQDPLVIDLFKINAIPTLMKTFNNKTAVFHNSKFDLEFLASAGISPRIFSKIHDTMIIGKVFEPFEKHSLQEMIKRHLGKKIDKSLQKSNWKGELSSNQLKYAALDVIYLQALMGRLSEKYNMKNLLYRSECSSVPAVVEAQVKGIKIDIEKTAVLMEEKRNQMIKYASILKEKYRIDPTSPKEIGHALEKEGIKLPKTEKGNHKTTETVLSNINHEIATLVLKYRKTKKELDILESYFFLADENGRLHPTFHLWKTASGRMSCGSI